MNIGDVDLHVEYATRTELIYEDVTGAFRFVVHRKLRHAFPVKDGEYPVKITLKVWVEEPA